MNQAPGIIAALRAEVESSSLADLPAIIGQIEAVKAEAFVRLVAAPPALVVGSPDSNTDRLLTVEETAERVGQTARWVRDHRDELPRVKLPGRTLRFSEQRLATFIKRRSYA